MTNSTNKFKKYSLLLSTAIIFSVTPISHNAFAVEDCQNTDAGRTCESANNDEEAVSSDTEEAAAADSSSTVINTTSDAAETVTIIPRTLTTAEQAAERVSVENIINTINPDVRPDFRGVMVSTAIEFTKALRDIGKSDEDIAPLLRELLETIAGEANEISDNAQLIEDLAAQVIADESASEAEKKAAAESAAAAAEDKKKNASDLAQQFFGYLNGFANGGTNATTPSAERQAFQQAASALGGGGPAAKKGSCKLGKTYKIENDSLRKKGHANGLLFTPKVMEVGAEQKGKMSWYGEPFHGRNTANSEVFNMYELMCAHATMQLPSYVRVTNLENGKIIECRVNDRGPFVKDGRIIDVSMRAAEILGFKAKGTAKVKLEFLKDECNDKGKTADKSEFNKKKAAALNKFKKENPNFDINATNSKKKPTI